MNKNSTIYISLILCAYSCLFFNIACTKKQTIKPYDLKCEYIENPLGVDVDSPRFSWKVDAENLQKNYNTTIWLSEDSIALESFDSLICWRKDLPNDAFHSIYDGDALEALTKYYWKVELKFDDSTREVASAFFVTGIVDSDSAFFESQWITDHHDIHYKPASYFRKDFLIDENVKSAYIVLASAGLYELSLNGERVGDHVLDPMYTRFDKRVLSVMYDVKKHLQYGGNVIGVELGNGWYNHQSIAVWDFDKAVWRNRPAFSALMKIEYENGNIQYLKTDSSWIYHDSPIVFNSIYTAEHYDARKAISNWNTVEYQPQDWQNVREIKSPTTKIVAQLMNPVREIQTFKCSYFNKINDSCYVYHFPKNIAGVVKLNVKGQKGTMLKIKHGELLYDDGTVNLENIDYHYRPTDDTDPFQTDIVYLSGNEDVFQPKFNYKGFQYVQIDSDKPIHLTEKDLLAISLHSDVKTVGKFNSSSELLNKIWEATNSSYLANLFGYPTDCPQREKNGWTGDAHIAIETGLYNFDAITIYEKWMNDFLDEQQPNGVLPCIIPTSVWGYDWANGVDWTSAVCIIPWTIYEFYDDTRLLERMYPAMKKYVLYIESISEKNLVDWGLGDWVPVSSQSDITLTTSIYYHAIVDIMCQSAKLFDYKNDEIYFSNLSENVRSAINNKFLNTSTGIYASGTQTELAMPLYWKVVPDEYQQLVATNLNKLVVDNNYHLDVGLLGSKAILGALTKNGFVETAYKLATQTSYPSWGHWIEEGATTLRENWDVNAVIDNSHNHIMFGEIGAWLYNSLAGIKIDKTQVGFKHVQIEPYIPEDMSFLEVEHECKYGKIVVSWKKNRNGSIKFTINIPYGVTASFKNPFDNFEEDIKVINNGRHVFILN